jgi:S1 RNA binding domain/Zc3h12a-like Ribonuclease NYN domain
MHIVVDGSNVATEGRQMPSLQQLHEAVMAFRAEHPDALITVVVDATFGHRIDAKEVPEFDAAIANNELVAPPAGAVGRGDGFVLSIANKVGATILSNDSYQEFHGQYDWLFDEGRLIGGKPVPHIGWVFVARTPVRGPISRKAMSEAKRKSSPKKAVRIGSPEASQPMPVPSAPPPGARLKGKPAKAAPAPTPAPVAQAAATSAAPKSGPVNDVLPFLSFVEHHPVGTSVIAVVDHYSSHGAYVQIGDVQGYVPLRLMADPAPRSAREVMKVGETVTLVVESFAAGRRSIDLGLPAMVPAAAAVIAPAKRSRKKAAPSEAVIEVAEAVVADAPAKRSRKKVTPAPAVDEPASVPVVEPVADGPAPAAKRSRKKAAPVPVEVVAEVPGKKPRKKAVASPPAPQPEPEPTQPPAKRRRATRSAG